MHSRAKTGALVSGIVPIAAPAATTMPLRGPRERSRSASDATVPRVKVAAPPVAAASCRHASHSALHRLFWCYQGASRLTLIGGSAATLTVGNEIYEQIKNAQHEHRYRSI